MQWTRLFYPAVLSLAVFSNPLPAADWSPLNRTEAIEQLDSRHASERRRALGRLAEKSRVSPSDLKAISISSKGLVADDNTTLLWSSVLGSQQINMRKTLEPDWQAKVTLNHESLLVASALHTSLSRKEGKPIPRLAALSLGHSIGLGVVHADTYESPRARAPGFGHMIHSHGGAL